MARLAPGAPAGLSGACTHISARAVRIAQYGPYCPISKKHNTKYDTFVQYSTRTVGLPSARDMRENVGWAGLSTLGEEGKSDSRMPRQQYDTDQPEEVAVAALILFQTSLDLFYERSNDDAAGLTLSMFENGIALM
eukprot:365629-Chlamydomonas_euryale.AAC.1